MLLFKSVLLLGSASMAIAGLGTTCKDFGIKDGHTLTAKCGSGKKGDWNPTELNLDDCFKRGVHVEGKEYKPISKCGKLQASNGKPFGWKEGDGNELILTGDCSPKSSLPMDIQSTGADLNNIDGKLVCSHR